jgi:hypothetical protein
MTNTTNTTYSYGENKSINIAVLVISICFLLFCCALVVYQSYVERYVRIRHDIVHERQRAEHRQEIIRDTLRVKEWTHDDSTVATNDEPSVENTAPDDSTSGILPERRPSPDLPDLAISESLSFSEDPGCAICLTSFKERDMICESSNGSCRHAFHRACMESWLLKHDDCPVCREKYLGVETV